MLNLSDADLARLRLECWTLTAGPISPLAPGEEVRVGRHVDALVAWCLRDRESSE